MPLFHKTLSDAKKALSAGKPQDALNILKDHKDAELSEEDYIESSLFAIRLYLHNYIGHLNKAIETLSAKDPGSSDLHEAEDNIKRCMENIENFEEAVKGLWQREGSRLK